MRISAEQAPVMADNSVQEQQEQQKPPRRSRGRPFEKGHSGNPAGRPRGVGRRASQAIQEMLDADARALTSKLVELALDGNTTALRMCLDRIGGRPGVKAPRLSSFPRCGTPPTLPTQCRRSSPLPPKE
jgi:hypothetical protein